MPTVISPSQALLLLIDKYSNNPVILDKLKKWYVGGIKAADQPQFGEYLKDPLFSKYQVSTDPRVINDDTTRRYFETHLAYRTIKDQIDKISLKDLQKHFKNLKESLPTVEEQPDNKKLRASLIALDGIIPDFADDTIKEYATYIKRINDGDLFNIDTQTDALRKEFFSDPRMKKLQSFFDNENKERSFTPQQKDKIKLLVQIAFLGVVNAWNRPELPLDIYHQGIFANENRGKVPKIDPEGKKENKQYTTRNAALGLLRGENPIPRNDIAFSTKGDAPSFLKPSDQASFDEEAQWVKNNYALLVHPFSNAISGTMLCQLRNLVDLKNKGWGIFTSSRDEFNQFSRLFTVVMLYGSGGHSLLEFIAPLDVQEVKEEFPALLISDKPITLESMFYTENQNAFNAALKETIDYNKEILKRREMLQEIDRNIDVHKFERDKEKLFQECVEAQVKKLFFTLSKQRVDVSFFDQIEHDLKEKKTDILSSIDIKDYSNLRALIMASIDVVIAAAEKNIIKTITDKRVNEFDALASEKLAELRQEMSPALIDRIISDLQRQRDRMLDGSQLIDEEQFHTQAEECINKTVLVSREIESIIKELEGFEAHINKNAGFLNSSARSNMGKLKETIQKKEKIKEIKDLLRDPRESNPAVRLADAKAEFNRSENLLALHSGKTIDLLFLKFKSIIKTDEEKQFSELKGKFQSTPF